MLTPFSSEDLGRVFDARTLTKGRTLILVAEVAVTLQDPVIAVTVEHMDQVHTATIHPALLQDRVVFFNECSCGQLACAHLAAGSLAALDRFPALRRAGQQDFLDKLAQEDRGVERQVLVFELSTAEPPAACAVTTLLLGARSGRQAPTTPAAILADPAAPESVRLLAKMLGSGGESRVLVAPAAVQSVLGLLARLGKARWHATGKVLALGPDRIFQANVPPDLPPRSAVILATPAPGMWTPRPGRWAASVCARARPFHPARRPPLSLPLRQPALPSRSRRSVPRHRHSAAPARPPRPGPLRAPSPARWRAPSAGPSRSRPSPNP